MLRSSRSWFEFIVGEVLRTGLTRGVGWGYTHSRNTRVVKEFPIEM